MAQKQKTNIVLNILKIWVPLSILSTIICGLVYVSSQQVLRQSANDPQIQMAEDTAQLLSTGAKAESVVPQTKIDIAKSLSPFVIIFDKSGTIVASNALLDSKNPQVPGGIFDTVKNNGEDRVTWEPQNGVRIAAVVTPYKGIDEGYVLVGRSLREVEKHEDILQFQVASAWIFSLFALFITSIIFAMV